MSVDQSIAKSLLFRFDRLVVLVRSFWKRLWPFGLSAAAVALGLFVNTWVSSQRTVIDTLREENAELKQMSAGLLQETVWYIDTLFAQVDREGVAYYDTLRQYGGMVSFIPYRHWDTAAGYQHQVMFDYNNTIDGMPMNAKSSSPRARLRMQFDKDRFEFTMEGRRYYLMWSKPDTDLDRHSVIGKVVALAPIFDPTRRR